MQRAKAYYQEHRDKVLKQRKVFRDSLSSEAKKGMRDYARQWYSKNFEKERERRKIYRENNKDRFKLYYERYEAKNPHSRFGRLLRHRVRISLKAQDLRKNEKLVKLLGASAKEVRKYIQSKFLPKMSWDNYGKWHIDHIIPLKNFDLSKPQERYKAFHFTNLQPLLALDNLRKGSKVNDDIVRSHK